jgi:hypothetical protein
MPLEGFRILDWASRTFGGLPATITGGLGVAILIAGIVIAVAGFKLAPISYSLIAAGLAMAVLSYFVVGSAISGAASGTLQGGAQVASAAPTVVPAAATTALFGLSLFAARSALHYWSDEEASGKVFAVLLGFATLGGLFIGIQVIRGGGGAPPPAVVHDDDGTRPPPEDPVRRGITTGRHR